MKELKKRLSELFSVFLSRKTRRAELSEFNDLLKQVDENAVFEVLKEKWENYEVVPNSFKEQQERIKLAIDQEIKATKTKKIDYKKSLNILWKVAAVLVLSFYVYQLNFNSDVKQKNIAVVTLSGERATVELPDGSKVQLNSASKLIYSSNFNEHNRLVQLEGEAFFDVKKSKTDKFVVKTKYHNIEVMGTTFNVLSYTQEEHFQLTLLTGKVKVCRIDDASNAIILKPHEKIEYDFKTQQLLVSNSDTDSETAWLRGELVIRGEPLKIALSHIERFYGVNIQHESINKIENEVFTGRFKKGDVEDVLKVISLVYPIKYSKNNQEIIMTLK